jgi:hypothetical protein
MRIGVSLVPLTGRRFDYGATLNEAGLVVKQKESLPERRAVPRS